MNRAKGPQIWAAGPTQTEIVQAEGKHESSI